MTVSKVYVFPHFYKGELFPIEFKLYELFGFSFLFYLFITLNVHIFHS